MINNRKISIFQGYFEDNLLYYFRIEASLVLLPMAN